MDVVGSRPDSQAKAEDILASIAKIDLEINPTTEDGIWTMDGIKKADEVVFKDDSSGNSAEDAMRKRGRMWVGRLSVLLGTPIAHDIFSEGGYVDSDWASKSSQMGGPLPLG
jgi:hypothetical protein